MCALTREVITDELCSARGRQMLEVVRVNTSFGERSFAAAAAPRVWNRLPDVVGNSALSEDAFAKPLNTYLMNFM